MYAPPEQSLAPIIRIIMLYIKIGGEGNSPSSPIFWKSYYFETVLIAQ